MADLNLLNEDTNRAKLSAAIKAPTDYFTAPICRPEMKFVDAVPAAVRERMEGTQSVPQAPVIDTWNARKQGR